MQERLEKEEIGVFVERYVREQGKPKEELKQLSLF